MNLGFSMWGPDPAMTWRKADGVIWPKGDADANVIIPCACEGNWVIFGLQRSGE